MNIKGTPIKTSTGIYRSKKGKIKINSEYLGICIICSVFGFIWKPLTSFLDIYIRHIPFNIKTNLIVSSICGIMFFLLPFICLKDETFIK